MASLPGSLSKYFSSLLHLKNSLKLKKGAFLQQTHESLLFDPELLLLMIPTVATQTTKSPASLYPLVVHSTVSIFVPASLTINLDWPQSFGECCIHVPCRVELTM
jgi:hypothetical protein